LNAVTVQIVEYLRRKLPFRVWPGDNPGRKPCSACSASFDMIEAGAKVAKCRPNQRRARFAGSRLLEIQYPRDGIWKDCPWCVYAGAGQALEIIFADRLHFSRRRSHAAQLRTNAEAGRNVAEKRTHRCHGKSGHLRGVRRRRVGGSQASRSQRARPLFRAEIRGIPAADDLEPIECVHLGIQRTGSHSTIPQFKATAKLGEFLEARFSQSL
jgi:hypothetical protein